MIQKTIACAALGLLAGSLSSVPAGAQILINGYEHEGEWHGAKTLVATADARLEALRDNNFLYLRLTRPSGKVSGADLYFGKAGERLFMLHVSSALSENSELKSSGYEYGVWGRNSDWTTNAVQGYFGADRKMQFVEPQAHEFQIALRKLPPKDVRLAVVLKRPESKLPPDADVLASRTWHPLEVEAIPRMRAVTRR